MSWGIKITVLYLGFVALILTLVFTCFGHKSELEYKDYYARELKFQDQIDASSNAANLETPIDYQVKGAHILVKIPVQLIDAQLSGKIVLFKPSDASQDKTIELHPDTEGKQIINGAGFMKGAYKMQISFNSGGKDYFTENFITLK